MSQGGVMDIEKSNPDLVTSSSTITDHAVVRGDGGARGIQDSGLLIDDSDNLVVPSSITAGETAVDKTFTINGASIEAVIAQHTSGNTDLAGFVSERHSDTAGFGAHSLLLRTRGTEGSSTVVQDDDAIGRIVGCGYDGTDFAQSSEIRMEVDGTPGSDDMPGRILLLTSADGTQAPIEGFRLDASQNVTLANALNASNGGTGRASHTAYAVLCGGTTTTAAQQSIAGLGSSGQVLTSNGAAALPTFQDTGDVTASANITDHSIVRGDGGAKGVQDSSVLIDDSDVVSGVTQLNVDNLRLDGNTLSSTDTDGNINLTPNGSGVVAGTELTLTTDLAATHGGTGRSSHTAYAVICGGTTTTAAQQSIAGVGTAAQVLTSNGAGALPTFQTAGGGGLATLRNTPEWFDDFITRNTGNGDIGSIGWSSIGTGNQALINAEADHPGILSVFATTTGQYQHVYLDEDGWIGGSGEITMEFVMKVVTLSDATDGFRVRVGFHDQISSGTPANGCYFEYTDDESSGAWVGTCRGSSSGTTAASTDTVDTDWHDYKIVLNAGATSCSFYVDGAEIDNSPITTNLPTGTSEQFGMNFYFTKIDGSTARQIYIDAVYAKFALTNDRFN